MEFKEFEPRFKSAKTRLKSWNIWYNFKWNQPYLNRCLNLNRRSNSLNSATGCKDIKIEIWASGKNSVNLLFTAALLSVEIRSLGGI